MAVCANCQHGVKDHDADGCKYGRAFKDQGGHCACPMQYEEESVGYEDAKPVANPDRISYKGAVNFADVPKVADTQVGGEHYRQTGIQPWDIIDAWGLDFYAGNALKYLYRAGRKGPKVEDLKKARHYIDKMIEKEES